MTYVAKGYLFFKKNEEKIEYFGLGLTNMFDLGYLGS